MVSINACAVSVLIIVAYELYKFLDSVSFYMKYYNTYDMAIAFLFGFHKTVQVMCNIRHLLKFA
jgi:hypothetical protein